jgi:hypothetical protein
MGGTPGEFDDIVMKRAGLTAEDARLLGFELYAWWQYRVQAIAHVDDLPSSERVEFDEGLRRNYGLFPVERLWYEVNKARKDVLNADAVNYIDNLLAQPG